MKISYNDISMNKDFKCFKEWHFLCTRVNSIKKKGYFENINFIGKNLFSLLIYILASIIWITVYQESDERFIEVLSIVVSAFSIFCVVSLLLSLFVYFLYYRNFKKASPKKKKNNLTIDEDGITDITDDITISSKWKQLTHVLLGEYYIMITTVTNIVYIFPVDIKAKLLSGLNKYNTNKELKIIEKNI